MENIYDLIIIGGGPAGLTAAIYTARAFITTLVLAGDPPGGQLVTTTEVENFPGFPEGITGPQLIEDMRKQAEKFGTEVKNLNVSQVTGVSGNFEIMTSDGTFKCKSVLIATGANARWLGLPSETRLRGHGVSACATCDGFFFKGKEIAVVGGGDASMEEANFLTKFASKVHVLVRSSADKVRASKVMYKRAVDNPKINFIYNSEVVEVLGESSVSGLKILNNSTNMEAILPVEGLFVAIGHTPSTEFLKGFVALDPQGYVVVNDNTRTSVEGVFVAGDVADHKYRQAISAAGMGCMAALDAERYLSSKNG